MQKPFIRLLSFLLALFLAAIILILPQTMTHASGKADHLLLMLLLTGISIGFIHGVGFRPVSSWLRYILSPVTSWPIMLYGLLVISYRSGLI